MSSVEFKNVSKIYENTVIAARNINLKVEDQELLVLVGPSGCGKSTVLRMVAGLEEITEGEILFDGKVVNDLPPKERNIAMVFQSYALYPHMNVYDNLAFGLKLRKYPKEEIHRRVMEAASILGIEELLKRKPKALSGGQRQRVALGRAIVRKPNVFLFDEPLSNLDAKMRVQMRTEIRRLNLEIKTTMIYVTHDQVEAMTLGDRLAVMNNGEILQVGTPLDLYSKPNSMFVAAFIGSPAMNFFDVELTGAEGAELRASFTTLPVPEKFKEPLRELGEKELVVGIRPEDIYVGKLDGDESRFHRVNAAVDVAEPLGNEIIFHLKCDGVELVAREDSSNPTRHGEKVDIFIDLSKIHLFSKKTEKAIVCLH